MAFSSRLLSRSKQFYSGHTILQHEHAVPARFFSKEAAPPALKGDEMLKNIFFEVKKKFETAMGILRKEKITIDPNDPAAVAQYAKVMKTVREKADLFSESQRIQYTIQTRTQGIPDARTYLEALKEIRIKEERRFEVLAFRYKPELFAAVFVRCNTEKPFRLSLHSGEEEEARNLLVEASSATILSCMTSYSSSPSTIMGGFVLIHRSQLLDVMLLRFPFDRDLFFVSVSPQFEAPKKKIHEALPKHVGMKDHVANCSQAGCCCAPGGCEDAGRCNDTFSGLLPCPRLRHRCRKHPTCTSQTNQEMKASALTRNHSILLEDEALKFSCP